MRWKKRMSKDYKVITEKNEGIIEADREKTNRKNYNPF